MRSTRRIVRAVLAGPSIALLIVAAPARAQAPASTDKVAAEALFEEGRRLVAAGSFSEACPKFADSQRLDPSPGTLLNLASCYEKAGRSATAWATYREAASAANAVGRADYVATAQRHADALAPKLARLTVKVEQPMGGLQVVRDGVRIEQATWGVPIPVDPGSHTIEASAPGYKAWASSVNVAQDGAQASLSVPPLEPLPPSEQSSVSPGAFPAPPPAIVPPPTPPVAPAPETSHGGSGQRVIGIGLAGAGVVGLGLAGVFAIVAKNQYSSSLSHCQTSDPGLCDSTGVSQRNGARSMGDAASVAVAVGAAALAGGLVLWLTAPSGEHPAPTARIGIAPTLGGAILQGAF